MKECGFPAAQLAAPKPASATQQQDQIYTDMLSPEIQEQHPEGELTYAVEVPNRDARSAGLSNQVKVPAAPTLPPPSNFAAEITASGVRLTWTADSEPNGAPAISHHYRVYRREAAGSRDVIIGELPLQPVPSFTLMDQSFEWEKKYLYRSEVVTTITGLRPCPDASVQRDCPETREVEGDDTPEVPLTTHDVFPPAVPDGVQAVYSGVGQQPFIDLTWAPGIDADLAGYNVYRRQRNNAAVKLNAELVRSPSYRDRAVAAGNDYSYSVSAVDLRGNESARSEEASESIPANQ